MNYREIAASIKQSVSMRQVVERYGFTPDRAGYIRCPFHAGDNQGSLKVYPGSGGWHCFGCGGGGSVIDFVMQFDNLQFQTACERINGDFGLALPIGQKLTRRERERRKNAIMTARELENRRESEQARINQKCAMAFDLWCFADTIKTKYSPENTGGQILPGYANAVRELPLLADNLTQAEIERWKFEHPEQSDNGSAGCTGLDES
jgi:hypothetical protein